MIDRLCQLVMLLAVTTLRDIQLEIAKEEFICTDDGIEIERDHSPGSFITMGLELEELQCVPSTT